jgi:predicted nucleic acid-binding protein
MKPKVYLETTFVSLLTAWPSRVLVRAAHQQSTREWWARRRDDFELFVSGLVLDEVKLGDAQAARDRVEAIAGLPVLGITEEIIRVAETILQTGCIPARAASDASHIAVGAVHRMHFLLTWNFRHINNAAIAEDIEKACSQAGYRCPVICTPDQLMRD